MRKSKRYASFVVALGSLAAMLTGCNETIQGTVEDGVINISSSLVGAIVRALIELASEAQAA